MNNEPDTNDFPVGTKFVFTNMTEKEIEFYKDFPMIVIEDNGNRVFAKWTGDAGKVIQSVQLVYKSDMVEVK